MLYYLATPGNYGPMRRYLQEWGGALHRQVKVLGYDALPAPEEFRPGAVIFSDVERLSPKWAEEATELWTALNDRGRFHLLNHPRRTLRRFELLRTLHDRGYNHFNVYRIQELGPSVEFPVFLRHADDHAGALTPLLWDEAALASAVQQLVDAGHPIEHLLAIEYLETGQDGLYRKYSVTRAGDLLLPHHIMFDREWQVKGPSLVSPEMMAEERAFQEEHPHRDTLWAVFELAQVDYGRADYGLVNGRPQIWEINTNPTLLYPRDKYQPLQMPAKHWFSNEMNEWIRSVARGSEAGSWLGKLLRFGG